MSNRQLSDHDQTQLVEELNREVDRKGSLFALMACLAIAAGLVLSGLLSIAG